MIYYSCKYEFFNEPCVGDFELCMRPDTTFNVIFRNAIAPAVDTSKLGFRETSLGMYYLQNDNIVPLFSIGSYLNSLHQLVLTYSLVKESPILYKGINYSFMILVYVNPLLYNAPISFHKASKNWFKLEWISDETYQKTYYLKDFLPIKFSYSLFDYTKKTSFTSDEALVTNDTLKDNGLDGINAIFPNAKIGDL